MAMHKILDLFAGAGGLSTGFQLFRNSSGSQIFEMHRAVEIDKYACETLRNNHGARKVIEGDLTKQEIHRQIIKECKGQVSIIMGGIPCQSFSLIGPRSGYGKKMEQFKKDKRDHLYKEFRKIVSEINPKIIVIENVKGILSKKDASGKKIIFKIISDFEKLGYNFDNQEENKYLLLNAADYGVPQKRERIILVGILKEWKNIKVPLIEPTHYELDAKKTQFHNTLFPYVTIFDAIGDLPKVKPKITNTGLSKKRWNETELQNQKTDNGCERTGFDFKRYNNHLEKTGKSGRDFLRFVRPNGYEYLDHHTARGQQFSDIELFKNMREGETAFGFLERNPSLARKLIKYNMDTFRDKYRKQTWNQPSTTLFAHLEKDGNRFIHPRQARTITPREAARLQSFPDDYIFAGPVSKKFRQIGNAVPPLMSYNIAKAIYKGVIK